MNPRLILAILAVWTIGANGCADFVIFLNGGSSNQSAEASRDLALSLVGQLELSTHLHRVALVTGMDPEGESIDFEKISSDAAFQKAIQSWEPSQLSAPSRGMEIRLEKAIRSATSRRRAGVSLVAVVLDSDASSAFMTNPSTFGTFAQYVRRRHYIHLLIVSDRPERIRTALNLSEREVDAGMNRDELRLIASPFTKCQLKLGNELRRKPIPRLPADESAVSATTPSLAILVTAKWATVPVSVHIPRSTSRPLPHPLPALLAQTATPPAPTTTTTPKPKKSGCQFDIVVLMDLSGGSADKLPRYQALFTDLVRKSELGPHATQFAAVRFSGPGRSDTVFHLNKHSNQTKLIEEINRIQPLGGTTRTAEAMRFAAREFEPKFGGRDRDTTERHMIVFTDGYSQDEPAEVAIPLSRERIHVYGVAVEDPELKPDLEQLRLVASDDSSSLLDAQFGQLINKLAPPKCR